MKTHDDLTCRISASEMIADESYDSVMRSLVRALVIRLLRSTVDANALVLLHQRLAENSRQIGADTLEMLGKQGDQLRRVQEDLDDIEQLQDRADRSMRAISSVGGALANKFSRKKGARVRPIYPRASHRHTLS